MHHLPEEERCHDQISASPAVSGSLRRFADGQVPARRLSSLHRDQVRTLDPSCPASRCGAEAAPGRHDDRPSNLGKVPGKFLVSHGSWVGFSEWTNHRATQLMLERWQGWHTPEMQVPICMQLSEHPGLDLDITGRQDIVDRIDAEAEKWFGASPARGRENSTRMTLFFRWEGRTPPVLKRSIVWDDTKLIDSDGNPIEQRMEWLGRGQQSVVEGPHKSGAMHVWPRGDLIEWENKLPLVDGDTAWAFTNRIIEILRDEFGIELKKSALPQGGHDTSDSIEIGNPVIRSPLAAPDELLPLLPDAVRAIDINHDRFVPYERFIGLLHATKAACDGNHQFFIDVMLPKLLEHPDNAARGADWCEEKWNGIKRSIVGYDTVFDMAAGFGYMAGAEAIRDKQIEEIFGAPDDTSTDGSGSPGLAQIASVGSGSVGPNPLAYTDTALAERFAADHPDWRYTPDNGWLRLESGVYIPNSTVIHPIGELCAEVGAPYRAQGGQQLQIDIRLNSVSKHQAVERALRAWPRVFAKPKEFDTDPWMLNTPGFIIDLRTGDTYEHGMLTRQQTAVAPDLLAYDKYEHACPRFLELLHHMSDDPVDRVLLGRHGAHGIIGEILDQVFLLIHGQRGTAKSTFSDICMRLFGTYVTAGSTTMFMRQNDKRSFDVSAGAKIPH